MAPPESPFSPVDPPPYGIHWPILNLDGTFRGYEWVLLDVDARPMPSRVYAQEGRANDGTPLPAVAR